MQSRLLSKRFFFVPMVMLVTSMLHQVVLGRAGLVRGIGEMLLLPPLVAVSSPCLHAAAFMCASRIMHHACESGGWRKGGGLGPPSPIRVSNLKAEAGLNLHHVLRLSVLGSVKKVSNYI